MADGGKGSRQRPVDKAVFDANFDRIFGKVESPCVDVCQLDFVKKICVGCHRTLSEIEAWSFCNDDEKRRILRNMEERKQHEKSDSGGCHAN